MQWISRRSSTVWELTAYDKGMRSSGSRKRPTCGTSDSDEVGRHGRVAAGEQTFGAVGPLYEFMRKELGKPTREYFFARLADVAPEFERCSTHDIKGFIWSFVRQQRDLYQWLWFQRHKYDDAFTVELSWSCLTKDPARAPSKSPADAFTPEGARFRLGAFWNSGGDYWWYVADPPPGMLEVSPEEYINRLLRPPEIDLTKALPRVHAAVDDAIARIREYALPYFGRVAEWHNL